MLVARYMFDARVLYMLGGIFMSVVAHELFHVLMHLGDIHSAELFPDAHAIFSMSHNVMSSRQLMAEESVAYVISAVVILITVIDVFAIHDSRSNHSATSLFESYDYSLSDVERFIK